MPLKYGNKVLRLSLSEGQYQVLLRQAEANGYISPVPGGDMEYSGSVAEYLRDHLDSTVPGFVDAKPIRPRGKYPRRPDK